MEELTLKIPTDRISFFKDLMKQLGFEISSDVIEIPEEHKKIAIERQKEATNNPSIMLDWKDAKKSL